VALATKSSVQNPCGFTVCGKSWQRPGFGGTGNLACAEMAALIDGAPPETALISTFPQTDYPLKLLLHACQAQPSSCVA
jgi:hypothetical protein